MPGCWQTWFPVWSTTRQHQSGSSREAFCRLHLLLRWCSTLYHLLGNSSQSVHWPGVSWRWWQWTENSARYSESSGRHHLGYPEQTLRWYKAWSVSTRSVLYDTWTVLNPSPFLTHQIHQNCLIQQNFKFQHLKWNTEFAMSSMNCWHRNPPRNLSNPIYHKSTDSYICLWWNISFYFWYLYFFRTSGSSSKHWSCKKASSWRAD